MRGSTRVNSVPKISCFFLPFRGWQHEICHDLGFPVATDVIKVVFHRALILPVLGSCFSSGLNQLYPVATTFTLSTLFTSYLPCFRPLSFHKSIERCFPFRSNHIFFFYYYVDVLRRGYTRVNSVATTPAFFTVSRLVTAYLPYFRLPTSHGCSKRSFH